MSQLFIPVILGTVRKGRMSEPIANFIYQQVSHIDGIETELFDICQLPIPMDNAGPNASIPGWSKHAQRADGFIIVTPEYNHTYPGLLKHVLDLNYQEYRRKAVGVCAVSSGPFGGVRAVEALLPSFKAYGLLPIVTDLNISHVDTAVNDAGELINLEVHQRRSQRFLRELIWLTKTLKYGRENFEWK